MGLPERTPGSNQQVPSLTDDERLRLQQFRTVEWMVAKASVSSRPPPLVDEQVARATVPERWSLTGDITLFDWQRDCVEKWLSGGRGTVKVVTGAGKTILALSIAEALQNRIQPDVRVAIVVPTIVLMNQWYDELSRRSNLPLEAIGRIGGGHAVNGLQDVRIVVAVLATAFKELPRTVRGAGWGARLLLVVDECHRAGATQMKQVLATERRWSLGLSATPEREGEEDGENDLAKSYDESPLGRGLGPIIYELTLAEALRLGIVPRFTIRHYGLSLAADERSRYERLSRIISDAQSQLRQMAPRAKSTGAAFFAWARTMAARGVGAAGSQAAQLVNETRRRKELLYRLQARTIAVEEILTRECEVNPGTRAILFHESIAAVNELFARLRAAGLPVVAEHSELPDSLREEGLELFRNGIARVVVSARSLIEGFNVPEADVGIIVASSSSVRQRIQSLGRMLRRHRGMDGEEATSVIHVLYARDTVDEVIYEKADWEALLGAESSEYFVWDESNECVRQPGPPRTRLPSEREIDPGRLKPGDVYPGRYEGIEHSADHMGNVIDGDSRRIRNVGDLPKKLKKVKGGLGRFRVTPSQLFVLVRVPTADDWTTLYVTRLTEPLTAEDFTSPADSERDPPKWSSAARPGDRYPFADHAVIDELKFSAKKGGVIERKVRDGVVWALVGPRAASPARGRDGQRLIEAFNELRAHGSPVTKFVINDLHHAIYYSGGQPLFVAALEEGLEFPQD